MINDQFYVFFLLVRFLSNLHNMKIIKLQNQKTLKDLVVIN